MQRGIMPAAFGHQSRSSAQTTLLNAQGVPFPSRPFFIPSEQTQTQEQATQQDVKETESQQSAQDRSGWNATQSHGFAQRQKSFNRRKGFGGRAAAPTTSKFTMGGFENQDDEEQQWWTDFGTGTFSSTTCQEVNQSSQSSNQEIKQPVVAEMKPSGGPPMFQKLGWSTDQSSVSTYQSHQKVSKNKRRAGFVVRPVPISTSKIGGFENVAVVEEQKSWAEFMGEKEPNAVPNSTVHDLFSNSTEIELAMEYQKEEELLKAAAVDVEAIAPPIQQLAELKTEETVDEFVIEKEQSYDSVWRVEQKKAAENVVELDPIKSISSDESVYSDVGEETWTEANPMGTGWRLGIFLDVLSRKEEGAQVEIWVAGEGMLKMKVTLDTADKVKSSNYLRFLPPASPDDFVKMTPSKHYASRASMVKVRPGKALEVRTTAVVAYSKACDIARVPVWCDPIGWLELDCSRFGVLRKGTEKDALWAWFRPLKIVEMTVRVRLDVPFEKLDYVRDGILVTDVVRILHVDKKENELPTKLFPLIPRRHHDLRLLQLEPDSPNKVQFKSRAYPEYTIFAERDQFAYEDEMEMRHLDMTAILVPANKSEEIYRALIVGPAQVLQVQTKDRIFDYRRAPLRRQYMPKGEDLIEKIKKDGLRYDQLFKRMELEKKYDRLPM